VTSARRVCLQNELDALLYRDRDSREKALEDEIARLRAIISDLQVSAPNAPHRPSTRRHTDFLCAVDRYETSSLISSVLIADVVCFCVLVRLVQSQLNDQYDHKRRGDYYYARCQALEEELRRSKVTPTRLSLSTPVPPP